MKTAVVHPGDKTRYKFFANPAIKKNKDAIIKITPSVFLDSDDDNTKKANGVMELFPGACGSCLFCNNPSNSNCDNNISSH